MGLTRACAKRASTSSARSAVQSSGPYLQKNLSHGGRNIDEGCRTGRKRGERMRVEVGEEVQNFDLMHCMKVDTVTLARAPHWTTFCFFRWKAHGKSRHVDSPSTKSSNLFHGMMACRTSFFSHPLEFVFFTYVMSSLSNGRSGGTCSCLRNLYSTKSLLA
jgi:hypothetical protein